MYAKHKTTLCVRRICVELRPGVSLLVAEQSGEIFWSPVHTDGLGETYIAVPAVWQKISVTFGEQWTTYYYCCVYGGDF